MFRAWGEVAHLVGGAVGKGAELARKVEVHGVEIEARARGERGEEGGHF